MKAETSSVGRGFDSPPRTHPEPSPAGEQAAAVTTSIERYRSGILTAAQADTLLPDVKRLVHAVGHETPLAAQQMLSTICSFLRDTAPPQGGVLAELFTETSVKAWTADRGRVGMTGRTLSPAMLRLTSALRRRDDLPARMSKGKRRAHAMAPLDPQYVEKLRAACELPAMRAFATVLGAGVALRHLEGSVFAESERFGLVLRRHDDLRHSGDRPSPCRARHAPVGQKGRRLNHLLAGLPGDEPYGRRHGA